MRPAQKQFVDELAKWYFPNHLYELEVATARIKQKYDEVAELLREFDTKYGVESVEAYRLLQDLRAYATTNKAVIEKFIKEMEK